MRKQELRNLFFCAKQFRIAVDNIEECLEKGKYFYNCLTAQLEKIEKEEIFTDEKTNMETN